MSTRAIGIIVIIIGLIIAVVSLVADYIGIGTYPGINSTQLIGAVIGAVVVLVGIWMTYRKQGQAK